jgi:HEPN domain-containing protein
LKKDIVLRWIKKAESDLKIVEYLIDSKDAPLDALCFHCQQAIEKYLKAYLTWIDIRVKKTHDLEAILNLCIKNSKAFERLERDKIVELTIYSVEVRYPEEEIEVTLENAREAYDTAKKVKDLVIKELEVEGMAMGTRSSAN